MVPSITQKANQAAQESCSDKTIQPGTNMGEYLGFYFRQMLSSVKLIFRFLKRVNTRAGGT